MLNGTLSLHDVRDVEAFCAKVVHRSGLRLDTDQQNNLLAYLIGECWLLSERYDPGNGHTTSFAGWAAHDLRRRVIDWARAEYGRSPTWYRPKRQTQANWFSRSVTWEDLSPQSRWTAREVALRISCGYSEREVARYHGVTAATVKGGWTHSGMTSRGSSDRQPHQWQPRLCATHGHYQGKRCPAV